MDALDNDTRWEHEGDLVVREISPEGLVTQVVRDARGELSAVLLPTGEAISFARDERGRVTGVYGHGARQDGLLFGYEHDAQPNVTCGRPRDERADAQAISGGAGGAGASGTVFFAFFTLAAAARGTWSSSR
ncbi:hypothetical protein WMF30_53415 [Sorangium sp. So ce134]